MRIIAATLTTLLLSTASVAEYAYAPVITFNMANYNDHGDWEKRKLLMANEILKNHASIVVLQEVRFDPNEPTTKASHQDMAKQLLTILKTHPEFNDAQIVTQPVMHYQDKWEGLSIISTYPILETGTRFLTKTADCKDNNLRATQYARLDVNGHPYIIANTHFGLTDACVKANIEETADYLKKFNKQDGILLLGDFNTTPDNTALSRLQKAGLTDVWATLHPNDAGYTFPSNYPASRIDYIFANTTAMKQIDGKEYVRVIGNHAEDSIYPSDHLGIVAELLAY